MVSSRKTRIDMGDILKGLNRMKEAKEPVARAMGVAMGQEVRDEAKSRAPVLKPGNEGYDGQVEGTLRDNIYLAFDNRKYVLNPNVYTYTVSWNSFRAAHGHLLEFGFEQPYRVVRGGGGLWFTPLTGGKRAKGRNTGFIRPDGPLKIEPQPFLGPAFDAKFNGLMSIAASAGRQKFTEVME